MLERGVYRALDNQCVNGDGTTGTGAGKQLPGLASLTLTSHDATALGSRWQAFAKACATVRSNLWRGQISVLAHPLDLFNALNEKTVTANAPVFADALAALSVFGVGPENFVTSALLTQGTVYVGSFSELATLYVREPITIRTAKSDQSDFVNGLVRVAIETRVALRPHANHASAVNKVVNF